MSKKKRKAPKNLALSLFGDAPQARVTLDKLAPKRDQRKPEKMDDNNCACE